MDGFLPRPNQILRPYTISPDSDFYRTWELCRFVLILYIFWVSPFQFVFLDTPPTWIYDADIALNVFFVLDVLLRTFFVAYFDKKTNLLVDNTGNIADNYLHSSMLIDVISLMYSIYASGYRSKKLSGGMTYVGANMLRLLHIKKIVDMFRKLEEDIRCNYFWVRLVKLICVTLGAVHFSGCAFYFIASLNRHVKSTWVGLLNSHETNVWTRYAWAMYWSVTTFSTTGYGDIHPVAVSEMVFTALCMLFNLGVGAYVLGNLGYLLFEIRSRTRNYRNNIREAKTFARELNLPTIVEHQIFAHLLLKFQAEPEENTLNLLPESIISSVSQSIFNELVHNIYLFDGVSADLSAQMGLEMRLEYFTTGDCVIKQGDEPKNLYFLVSGALEVKNNDELVVLDAQNNLFGEVGVICDIPQLFNVRAKRYSRVLRLNRRTFLKMVGNNNEGFTKIMDNFCKHMENSTDERKKGIWQSVKSKVGEGGTTPGTENLLQQHMLFKAGEAEREA